MEAATSNDDALAELLGDALRRGPGSPEWHDAVATLRAGGGANSDETDLLLQARERLAAGKEYRTVRAGPEFTRGVFERLDATPAKPKSRLMWLTAGLSAAMLLISAGVIVVLVSRSEHAGGNDLGQRLFIAPLQQYVFTQPAAVGFDLDKSWHIDRASGLRPVVPADVQRLELPKPIDLTSPICVEAVIDYQRNTDSRIGLIASNTAATPTTVEVEFARGGIVAKHDGATDRSQRDFSPGTYVLRLKVDGDRAVAEIDGKAIWAGPVDLGEKANLAVEFRKVGKDTGAIRLEAVRILGVSPGGAGQ